MRKLILSAFVLFFVVILPYPVKSQLLNGYNQRFYPTVFDAAEGVAMPFLLQQGYKTMTGVTIEQDTLLVYNGTTYYLTNRYQNPEKGNGNNYYLTSKDYSSYQIDIFKNVWHINIPNVFYNYNDNRFSSLADCVGFGTRLLSSVGDTTESGNAYLNLINSVRSLQVTPMAVKGFVASAYEIGAAFPVLPDVNPGGWEYVSGNIISDSINAYNHRLHSTLGEYNGRVKGNYGNSIAGDILAFSYGPGGESNGHFMVMSASPYRVNADTLSHFYPNVHSDSIAAFLTRYNVWATPVYDCSGHMAHFHDSRTITSGIGHGTLWILTGPGTDVPLGLIFKTPKVSDTEISVQMLNDEHTWAISVGRFWSKLTGNEQNGTNIPTKPELEQNYPNPFNPATNIKYSISSPGMVKLAVYDMQGRVVQSLVNSYQPAGRYEVSFNAGKFASGVYFYSLSANNFTENRKMILIK